MKYKEGVVMLKINVDGLERNVKPEIKSSKKECKT